MMTYLSCISWNRRNQVCHLQAHVSCLLSICLNMFLSDSIWWLAFPHGIHPGPPFSSNRTRICYLIMGGLGQSITNIPPHPQFGTLSYFFLRSSLSVLARGHISRLLPICLSPSEGLWDMFSRLVLSLITTPRLICPTSHFPRSLLPRLIPQSPPAQSSSPWGQIAPGVLSSRSHAQLEGYSYQCGEPAPYSRR